MAAPVQLPEDVIYFNILPRLPYRALMRLTAVCKAWRRIIRTDDAFATAQARTPSSASVAMARFVRGRLRILTPCWSADVKPQDPSLSFVEVNHGRLSFCACTGGVLCLVERPEPHRNINWLQWQRYFCTFVVVNPNRTTQGICRLLYAYPGEVVTAGLAYDPETATSNGFHLVVPAKERGADGWLCRFRRFTSRLHQWTSSREAYAMPPLEEFKPNPVYFNGCVLWLAGDVVVWYDPESDRGGTTPLLAAGGGRCDGNLDISVWRGRLRLARVTTIGVSVCELADGDGAGGGHWEMVHSKLWVEVPGIICPQSSWTCARWKLETVEMEAAGEEAVWVVMTMEREFDDGTRTWRGLLRYDVRTGAALSVLELGDRERIGPLVDYHSSMAKLKDITWMGDEDE